jgi:hypothetical protein
MLERVHEGALHLRMTEGAANNPLRRFLDETGTLPPWANEAEYVAGRNAMMRFAPGTFLAMLCGSLVESFALPDAAAVLVKTGRLLRDATPRIYETASLVYDMLLPQAEQPGRRAHTSLLRVRLLHAAVRRWAARKSDGVPVNQMQMAHTLLMFSRVVVNGVQELGAQLTSAERASWCSLWRLGGHLLGVDRALLPANLDEEAQLYRAVRSHYAPDDGSRALAHSVLRALAHQPPFFLPEEAMHVLSRKMLGEELGDAFDLKCSRRWSTAADVLKRAIGVFDGTRITHPFSALAGRAFIEINRARVLRNQPKSDYSFRIK